MSMTVTFFGHRECTTDIMERLLKTLRNLIENKNADIFYVGNNGSFDSLVKAALKSLKLDYPPIRYSVVLAYLPIEKDSYPPTDFSDTLFPYGLKTTPKRFAISKRNLWMIEQADTVITYVCHNSGGAAKFKLISEKKGKSVINLGTLK